VTRESNRFPYWLIVLGFPLFGGLFLGVAVAWSWATGWARPPAPLAVPVECFVNNVVTPLGFHLEALSPPKWRLFLLLGFLWEVGSLSVGIVVGLFVWLVSLLAADRRVEER